VTMKINDEDNNKDDEKHNNEDNDKDNDEDAISYLQRSNLKRILRRDS
jgi:hypothetical protein